MGNDSECVNYESNMVIRSVKNRFPHTIVLGHLNALKQGT